MALIRQRIPLVGRCANYILLNKPYNVYSQPPSYTGKGCDKFESYLKPILLDEVKRQHGNGEQTVSEWRTVHRLDQNVTGGILIATNKNASKQFSRNLQKGGNKGYKLVRKYVGLLHDCTNNSTKPREGILFDGVMASKYKQFDDNCFIFELETGKKHQLRKHASWMLQRPILNDVKYNGPLIPGSDYNQIALHSAYVKTVIGLQERIHLIPMVFNNNGLLWSRKYVQEDGNFVPKIIDYLMEDWDNMGS